MRKRTPETPRPTDDSSKLRRNEQTSLAMSFGALLGISENPQNWDKATIDRAWTICLVAKGFVTGPLAEAGAKRYLPHLQNALNGDPYDEAKMKRIAQGICQNVIRQGKYLDYRAEQDLRALLRKMAEKFDVDAGV